MKAIAVLTMVFLPGTFIAVGVTATSVLIINALLRVFYYRYSWPCQSSNQWRASKPFQNGLGTWFSLFLLQPSYLVSISSMFTCFVPGEQPRSVIYVSLGCGRYWCCGIRSNRPRFERHLRQNPQRMEAKASTFSGIWFNIEWFYVQGVLIHSNIC